MTRRPAALIAIALLAAGCSSSLPGHEPVTADTPRATVTVTPPAVTPTPRHAVTPAPAAADPDVCYAIRPVIIAGGNLPSSIAGVIADPSTLRAFGAATRAAEPRAKAHPITDPTVIVIGRRLSADLAAVGADLRQGSTAGVLAAGPDWDNVVHDLTNLDLACGGQGA